MIPQKGRTVTNRQLMRRVSSAMSDARRALPTDVGLVDTLFVSGSVAYGLTTETSDVDIRGMFADDPRRVILGRVTETVVAQEKADDHAETSDAMLWSTKKTARLISVSNPHMLEFLGMADAWRLGSPFLEVGRFGRACLENKERLVSRGVAATFGGFAEHELKRIETTHVRAVTKSGTAKAQCHYVRLLHMGTEMLLGEEPMTDRRLAHDADMLMDIKHGTYVDDDGVPTKSWGPVVIETRAKFDEAADLSAARNVIREKPDTTWLSQLVARTRLEDILSLSSSTEIDWSLS